MTEPEEWLDQRRARRQAKDEARTLWVLAAVTFVAAMFGVVVAELVIWIGGQL